MVLASWVAADVEERTKSFDGLFRAPWPAACKTGRLCCGSDLNMTEAAVIALLCWKLLR